MMMMMMMMLLMTMMTMTIKLTMVLMTKTHLDGVPLVTNPGVGFIGGELWHHVSV